MQTPESKALRHAFFGERAASKIPDVPADTPLREIKSAAVIGAGTMGGGIAMALAAIDMPVTLIDASASALERGLQRVRDNYATSLRRGKLDEAYKAAAAKAAVGPPSPRSPPAPSTATCA